MRIKEATVVIPQILSNNNPWSWMMLMKLINPLSKINRSSLSNLSWLRRLRSQICTRFWSARSAPDSTAMPTQSTSVSTLSVSHVSISIFARTQTGRLVQNARFILEVGHCKRLLRIKLFRILLTSFTLNSERQTKRPSESCTSCFSKRVHLCLRIQI